jgi:membrane protein involved in colicin uptake
VNRSILTTCIFLSAALPAAAQQHNQQHAPPKMGKGQVHPGGNEGMSPHMQQQMIKQQQMMEHQMMLEMQRQQAAARQMQAQHAKQKQGANQNGAGTAQPGKAGTPKGAKGAGEQGTAATPTGKTAGTAGQKQTAAEHKAAEHNEAEHKAAEHKAKEAREKHAAEMLHKEKMAAEHRRLPLASDQGAISTLRTVHAKLREADHDYGGNRANAMHSVTSAIHDLGSTDRLGNMIDGTGRKPLEHSNALLRESLMKLRNVESHLSSTSAPAHHTQARHAVAQAIHHVESALQHNQQGGVATR